MKLSAKNKGKKYLIRPLKFTENLQVKPITAITKQSDTI